MANYRNGEETRNLIIRTANRLFWEKGYAAVSFDDIRLQAHVQRSTIHYHFKTKDLLLRCCKEYTIEKAILAASCYCSEPSYLYILAKSIYWYYVIHDRDFFNMATEYAKLEITNPHTGIRRFEQLIACFLPALDEAGLEKPIPLSLTEVALRGLDHAPFLLGVDILEKTLEQLMEDYTKMIGQICGLPHSVSESTWQSIHAHMQSIPYDMLHIRWP